MILTNHSVPCVHVEFDPATGALKSKWQGEVSRNSGPPPGLRGMYDFVSHPAILVAFYRLAPEQLELYVEGQRIPIRETVLSVYEPRDPGRLPFRLRGTGHRRFTLVERGNVVFSIAYRGETFWERLIGAWESTTPHSGAYDVLYRVHEILSTPGQRDAVFPD